MNQFKHISHRNTWCQLKRLQSSSSALSTSNSKIQIPYRIKREPTDILHAIESTIPNDEMKMSYAFHDDPFLLPLRKSDFRNYLLSYEAGKKAAMWIHKEHKDLFPKHLSEPEIKAYQPPPSYDDKSQVSEKVLLDAIHECKISDAIDIYKLLGSSISNATKQALLELLCFYNNESSTLIDFPFERWFMRPKNKRIWQFNSEMDELYQFLIIQDTATASAARNVMICGLSRYARADEAWSLYQECKNNNVPLNVTTYNYVLMLLPEVFSRKNAMKVENMFNILKDMNKENVKPNVRTLNAALRVVSGTSIDNVKDIVQHLFTEFKRMNIKLSLASYYYCMNMLSQKDHESYQDFLDILSAVGNKKFTIQDPMDVKFFTKAMQWANEYNDRKSGDTIHTLLNTGGNYKFISDSFLENSYYSSYISLLLSTSTVTEFFKHYERLVPHVHVPSKRLLKQILDDLAHHAPNSITKYLPRLWSDVNMLYHTDLSLKLSIIRLMKLQDLPEDLPLRTSFLDATANCWSGIKKTIEETPERYSPIETAMTGSMALMLLRGGRLKESIEILTSTVRQSHLFVPTMNEGQLNELFGAFISEQCIDGAYLVLEYAMNAGFSHTVKMAKEIYNLPQLTNTARDKLINLVGEDSLRTPDTSKLD